MTTTLWPVGATFRTVHNLKQRLPADVAIDRDGGWSRGCETWCRPGCLPPIMRACSRPPFPRSSAGARIGCGGECSSVLGRLAASAAAQDVQRFQS
eukprot:scaffold91_cov254-Pinguiococcus_pyrenoidosus.AAC.46